jgi:hypothetical protein
MELLKLKRLSNESFTFERSSEPHLTITPEQREDVLTVVGEGTKSGYAIIVYMKNSPTIAVPYDRGQTWIGLDCSTYDDYLIEKQFLLYWLWKSEES